jgi:hypothetical protein
MQDGGAGSSSAGILPKGAADSTHSSLELLLLNVNLSWPISLVVSKRQLLHYQVRCSSFKLWLCRQPGARGCLWLVGCDCETS